MTQKNREVHDFSCSDQAGNQNELVSAAAVRSSTRNLQHNLPIILPVLQQLVSLRPPDQAGNTCPICGVSFPCPIHAESCFHAGSMISRFCDRYVSHSPCTLADLAYIARKSICGACPSRSRTGSRVQSRAGSAGSWQYALRPAFRRRHRRLRRGSDSSRSLHSRAACS